MERPKVNTERQERKVTGEVVYYDHMRRLNRYPEEFSAENLSEADMQAYKIGAEVLNSYGLRPAIMDEYERYDDNIDPALTGCLTFVDELLKYKQPESRLTYVDFVVDRPASEIVDMLNLTKFGGLLAKDDQQLARASDGEYYPILDITKRNSTIQDVAVRAWGWDDPKFFQTTAKGEKYDKNKDMLLYPSDEMHSIRELDVTFSYMSQDGEYWTEKVYLYATTNGSLNMGGVVSVASYAETGDEGHSYANVFQGVQPSDALEFVNFIADIIGDDPESFAAYRKSLADIKDE